MQGDTLRSSLRQLRRRGDSSVSTETGRSCNTRRLRWAGEVLDALDSAGAKVEVSRKWFLRECNSIRVGSDDGIEYLTLFFQKLSENCSEWHASLAEQELVTAMNS